MTEKGRVLSVREGRAVVEILRGPQCADCNFCSSGISAGRSSMELEAVEGLKPGHEVTVEIDSGAVLKGGTAVFLAPLIAFIVGAAAGPDAARLLGVRLPGEIASIVLGGALLVLTLLGVYLRARRPKYQQKLTPKIIAFN